MKMIRVVLGFALFSGFLAGNLAAADLSATNPPAYRLTIELRDGSRVIGECSSDHLKFHSALLGDLKLWVKDIRSMECVSSNTAKLMTADGDTLMVWFADSEVKAKTSFGKVELAVDSIRKITVSSSNAAGARRPGLIALWSGEDNGKDSIGSNDAELTDIDFADGQVGRAFLLNGESSGLKIPANPRLNVGAGEGFTLGVWINPTDVSKNSPLFEWVKDGVQGGSQFYIYPPDGGPGTLYALLGDAAGGVHYFYSSSGVVVANRFQYVALTYDKASGVAKIYCNGVIVAQQNLGHFTPQTYCDLHLGKRPLINGETWSFTGSVDEAAIYDRALSAAEIREICTEDNHGEALPPPVDLRRSFPFRSGIINQ
jgi:Concanavalin A-like lectin/glucanases superfamily